MADAIKVGDIYDKHLNFLIGSGASYGLFPTLALEIKDEADVSQTIETLATRFEKAKDASRYALLFMHYYRTCIRPVCQFAVADVEGDAAKQQVLDNYEAFLQTLLRILDRRRPNERRCNVFTTNYDGCFTHIADRILERGASDFVVNDGTRGFRRKTLHARNFNTFLSETGVFDQHHTPIPQLNLIHLHGSVYWRKQGACIEVDYRNTSDQDLVPTSVATKLESFSTMLLSDVHHVSDLPAPKINAATNASFWKGYEQLPIVNPTKWKFHETVFEEHYYQMLRMLSYELERPNAVLITFGFSFADEHILNLVKRSLSNPRLQVFVCCFDESEREKMVAQFGIYKNVRCITAEGVLNFSAFNNEIFALDDVAPATVAGAGA
jgi:hypothetical protein